MVAFASSDPSIAGIDQFGKITPKQVGHVTFYATTLAYGVTKRDSLPFLIGHNIGFLGKTIWNIVSRTPRFGSLTPILSFDLSTLIVGGGATVVFVSQTTDTVDVTFDDTTAFINASVTNGNGTLNAGTFQFWVAGPGDVTLARLHFPVDGTYPWHSHKLHQDGRIIVSD